MEGVCVCVPTVSDEGSAREHFPQHVLDHRQGDAHQAADDGHAEQEVILGEREGDSHVNHVICSSCVQKVPKSQVFTKLNGPRQVVVKRYEIFDLVFLRAQSWVPYSFLHN